jgi:DNA repair protein RecN (Recombination protein N)
LKDGVVSEVVLGLEELSIRNLGVIESAQVAFSPGLNVLTGETGAGKTMVLTALSLILGGKADADRVRTGEERLQVAGLFSVNNEIAEQVEEVGGSVEATSLLITRAITADGKSRITLGGVPSTNNKVAEIASELVEVHAQSSTQRLSKPAYVRSALDQYAGLANEIADYEKLFSGYRALQARILTLKRDESNRSVEVAKLKEFAEAFNAVTPKRDDLDEIAQELVRLESVDELQQAVATALNLLESEDAPVTSILTSAVRSLQLSASKDPSLEQIAMKFADEVFALNDSISALMRYLAAVDADPAKLDYLQNRKAAINSLIKKYGVGSDREEAFLEIIERGDNISHRLADLEGGSARIDELTLQEREDFKVLAQSAKLISQTRTRAAAELSTKISEELSALSMPHARVEFVLTQGDLENDASYAAHGVDEVAVLFASHEGSALLPLSKSASGGELSRVMLAIEVVLAASALLPTYIFDEVDAGVGGKAAMEVGKRLAQLATLAQVIVVTHLPQVAVWADNHLVVRKSESGLVSNSDISTLNPAERKVEIARMLSGQEGSQSAQEHAQELLEMVATTRA